MNSTIAVNELKQLRGKAKQRWQEFTNKDLDKLEGKRDELVGLVQEKYGLAKQTAEQEVDQFLDNYNAKVAEVSRDLSNRRDQLKDAASQLPQDVDQTVIEYRWAAVALALGVGFVLGFLMRPCRSGTDRQER